MQCTIIGLQLLTESDYYDVYLIYVAQINSSQLVLGEKLGTGGYATVVAARYLGQDVAVKQFHDASAASIIKEMGSMCHLQHEFIVAIRGVSTDSLAHDANGGHIGLALVMQRAKYGSVFDVLRDPTKRKMLSSRSEWLLFLANTARGVSYLHSQSPPFLHRDIKPGNILVSEQCHPLVADFGLVCSESSDCEPFQGTINYMAPELMREGKASFQTDVYAFGLLMWFVACGAENRAAEPCAEPWTGYSAQDVEDLVMAGKRPAWPSYIIELSSLARFLEVGLPSDSLVILFYPCAVHLSLHCAARRPLLAPRSGSAPFV
jgi:serine/threonine protein kinase